MEDPWLLEGGSKVPVSVKDAFKGKMINSLLNEGGSWNEELFKEVFDIDEATRILNIPRGRTANPDSIIWGFDLNGSFNVKSAYHLAADLSKRDEAFGSNEDKTKHLWKPIWSLKCIPRAKIIVWKIINNIIPTQVNLCRKGINAYSGCLFCRIKAESTVHIIWRCKFFRKVWEFFLPNLQGFFNSCRNDWGPMDFWEGTIKIINSEDRIKAMLIMWRLWTYQNQCLHNSQQPDNHNIIQNISCYIESFLEKEDKSKNLANSESHSSHSS